MEEAGKQVAEAKEDVSKWKTRTNLMMYEARAQMCKRVSAGSPDCLSRASVSDMIGGCANPPYCGKWCRQITKKINIDKVCRESGGNGINGMLADVRRAKRNG